LCDPSLQGLYLATNDTMKINKRNQRIIAALCFLAQGVTAYNYASPVKRITEPPRSEVKKMTIQARYGIALNPRKSDKRKIVAPLALLLLGTPLLYFYKKSAPYNSLYQEKKINAVDNPWTNIKFGKVKAADPKKINRDTLDKTLTYRRKEDVQKGEISTPDEINENYALHPDYLKGVLITEDDLVDAKGNLLPIDYKVLSEMISELFDEADFQASHFLLMNLTKTQAKNFLTEGLVDRLRRITGSNRREVLKVDRIMNIICKMKNSKCPKQEEKRKNLAKELLFSFVQIKGQCHEALKEICQSYAPLLMMDAAAPTCFEERVLLYAFNKKYKLVTDSIESFANVKYHYGPAGNNYTNPHFKKWVPYDPKPLWAASPHLMSHLLEILPAANRIHIKEKSKVSSFDEWCFAARMVGYDPESSLSSELIIAERKKVATAFCDYILGEGDVLTPRRLLDDLNACLQGENNDANSPKYMGYQGYMEKLGIEPKDFFLGQSLEYKDGYLLTMLCNLGILQKKE
jgi:hypothetical protein